jgi:hypothetical protein
MKTITMLAFGIFATVLQSQGQNNAISQLFDQYENREDITTISLTGKIFEMMTKIEADTEDGKALHEMASQIDGLRMIIDDNDLDAANTARKARETASRNFEDLVTIKEKNTMVNVMVDEANGVVSELLVVIGSDKEFILASLTGKMLLSDVGKLTSQMSQVSSNMFSETTVEPVSLKIYPNPIKSGDQITIELSEALEGADVRIFNASGVQVGSYKAQRGVKRYDTSKIGKGTYVLKAEKGNTVATTKFIVE